MLQFKLLFLGITLTLITLIDLYGWQGIRQLPLLGPRRRKTLKYLWFGTGAVSIIGILLMLFAGFFEGHMVFRTYFSAFLVVIYLSKLVLLPFLLIDDLRRLLVLVIRKIRTVPETETEKGGTKISRSQFLSTTGTLAATAPLIVLTRGMFKGAYDYRIIQQNIYLPGLPAAFDGLKIVQLSDIHTGSLLNKDAVYKGVEMVKSLKADLFFFTGDLVNNEAKEAVNFVEMFGEIKAPMGRFSILGNHDYGDYKSNWASEEEKKQNLEKLYQTHREIGWNLLRNEHLTLDKSGSRIGLIGVENWGHSDRFPKYGDLQKSMQGMPDVPVKILLSHDPSHWDAVVRKEHPDIDLTLSGHTHGMQFGIEIPGWKWSPAQYLYPRWAGQYVERNQQIYVNRGFGFLGYPGRVGILPEITLLTLRTV